MRSRRHARVRWGSVMAGALALLGVLPAAGAETDVARDDADRGHRPAGGRRGAAVLHRGQPPAPVRRRHDRHRRASPRTSSCERARRRRARHQRRDLLRPRRVGPLRRRRGHRPAVAAAGVGAVRRPTAPRSASSPPPTCRAAPSRSAASSPPTAPCSPARSASRASAPSNGQLIMWFPPYDVFPGPPGAYPDTDERSTSFCKLATDLGTAGAVAIDDQGRVYVAESSGLSIERFSPPFPTGPDAAGGCGGVDATGAPVADAVQREIFATPVRRDAHLLRAGHGTERQPLRGERPHRTHRRVRPRREPRAAAPRAERDRCRRSPPATRRGSPSVPTAPCTTPTSTSSARCRTSVPVPTGAVRRIRFDADGDPLPPDVVRAGLAFPDGVAVVPGDLETPDPVVDGWPTLAGGARATLLQPDGGLAHGRQRRRAGRAVAVPHRRRGDRVAVDRHRDAARRGARPGPCSCPRGTGSSTPSTGTTAASCGGSRGRTNRGRRSRRPDR